MKVSKLFMMTMCVGVMLVTPIGAGATKAQAKEVVSEEAESKYDSPLYLQVGRKITHSVTDLSGRALPVDSWKSSNEKVVTVKKLNKKECTINPKGAGQAIITADIDGLKYKILVDVEAYSICSRSEIKVPVNCNSVCGFTADVWNASKVKVTCDNPSLVDIRYISNGLSKMMFHGKKAGKSKLTFTDTTTGNTQRIDIKVTKKSFYQPLKENKNATYRALCVSVADTQDKDESELITYSAKSMQKLFTKRKYQSSKVAINVTKEELHKKIQSSFKDAKKEDVSVFYFVSNAPEEMFSKEFVVSDGKGGLTTISYDELASWLKEVPGTVVVLFDADVTGERILDPENAVGALKDGDQERMSANILRAFENADAQNRDAEFLNKKFRVVLTFFMRHSFVENSTLFSWLISEGAGFNADTYQNQKKYADMNSDKKVTLDELNHYVNEMLGKEFTSVYPENNMGLKIFE